MKKRNKSINAMKFFEEYFWIIGLSMVTVGLGFFIEAKVSNLDVRWMGALVVGILILLPAVYLRARLENIKRIR
jgi:hypothetical protein